MLHTVQSCMTSSLFYFLHFSHDSNVLSTPGAVVGLQRTFYQVSEGVGVVEVCAIVHSPVVDCPIEFPFDVTLSTLNGSAGEEKVVTNLLCK